MTCLTLALLNSPAMIKAVSMFVNVVAEHIVNLVQSQASVCLWCNVNSSNNDWRKLPEQIEWAANNGQMFQMRRAGARQSGDIPWVTPFLVNHETHSSTFCIYWPRLFCPSVKQKSYQTALQQCPGRVHEPCFRRTKNVTIPYVPLETYPDSIVHLSPRIGH